VGVIGPDGALFALAPGRTNTLTAATSQQAGKSRCLSHL